jgi:drug/metabolite transporter (DMT)-like permease
LTSPGDRKVAYAAWIAVCLIWGTTYLAIKICLETIPPALMGGIRYITGGTLLGGALLVSGERLPPRSSLPGHIVLGFLMLTLGNGGVVFGEQWLPSGLTAVLIATTPFWMVAIEALLPAGERLGGREILGLLVGFGGILMLVWPDLTFDASGGSFAAGLIAVQVACIGWSSGSALSRRYGRSENVLGAAAIHMLSGGSIMLLLGTLLGEWPRLSFTPTTLTAFIYLIIVGGIGGFGAYIYALKHLPVATVSLYAYINPVIAVVLGTLVLDEPFDTRMAMASIVILAGVALVRSGHTRSPTTDEVSAAA